MGHGPTPSLLAVVVAIAVLALTREAAAQAVSEGPPMPPPPRAAPPLVADGPPTATRPANRSLADLFPVGAVPQSLGRARTDRGSREGSPITPDGEHLIIRTLGLEDGPHRIHGWIQTSFTGNPANPANGT